MTTYKLTKITENDKHVLINITSDKDTMKSIGDGRSWNEQKVNKFYVTIFIDKSNVGQGYGTIFLKKAILKFMKLKPDTPIYADIEESNIASQKLHIKLGFKPIGKLHKINPKSSKMYQTFIIHEII